MGTTIHSIPMGVSNIYILRDRGTVVIDGGAPKKDKVFLKNLEKAAIKPEEISAHYSYSRPLGSYRICRRY